MKFIPGELNGVWIVELEKHSDERGYFARTWCAGEFERNGLNPRLAQCNISYNRKRGTLRGMHYQLAPRQEAKLIRCSRGAIYDVALDLRPESPTFKRWMATELAEKDSRMLYIAEGFAHGFQTLEDDTEVFYRMSEFFHQPTNVGLRWNDPAFAIQWPEANPRIISNRDASYPDFHA